MCVDRLTLGDIVFYYMRNKLKLSLFKATVMEQSDMNEVTLTLEHFRTLLISINV